MSLRTQITLAGLGTLAIAVALAAVGLWSTSASRSTRQFTPPPSDADDVLPDGANFGYQPDPPATERFLATLDKPTLRAAAPQLFADRTRQPVLLYPAYLEAYRQKYDREWVCGRQGIGDCVSWGWAHGASIGQAVSWKLGGTGAWHEAATEPIYGGSRVEARGKPGDGQRPVGGFSDGSYGSAAAKWVKNWGVIYRETYPAARSGVEPLDLTRYSSARAKQWGAYGNGGSDRYWAVELDNIAKKHPARNVALVTTWEELCAAISNGYPVPVCSGQGFARTRDRDGFSAPQGSWAHCMCFIGVRYDREGALCLNSWGPSWISGPKWPDGRGHDPNNPRGPPPAQPDGSFWVSRSVVERMLRGRDSFAIGDQDGWPARKLDHTKGW